MFKAGLVLRKGPAETVFDAIRKGYPVKEVTRGSSEIPATVGQQEASAVAQQEQAKLPDVVAPGPAQTCPPGYTYALGYCVRDVNYYGCIPGVEFWDGTKCSRNWPKCSEGINNDLNTGQCLNAVSTTTNADGTTTFSLNNNATQQTLDALKPIQTTAALPTIVTDPLGNITVNGAVNPASNQPPVGQAQTIVNTMGNDVAALQAKLQLKAKTITTIPTFDTSGMDTTNPLPVLSDVVKSNPGQEILMPDGTKQVYDADRQELKIYDSNGNLLSINSYIPLDPTDAYRENTPGTTAYEAVRNQLLDEKTLPTVTQATVDRPSGGATRRRRR